MWLLLLDLCCTQSIPENLLLLSPALLDVVHSCAPEAFRSWDTPACKDKTNHRVCRVYRRMRHGRSHRLAGRLVTYLPDSVEPQLSPNDRQGTRCRHTASSGLSVDSECHVNVPYTFSEFVLVPQRGWSGIACLPMNVGHRDCSEPQSRFLPRSLTHSTRPPKLRSICNWIPGNVARSCLAPIASSWRHSRSSPSCSSLTASSVHSVWARNLPPIKMRPRDALFAGFTFVVMRAPQARVHDIFNSARLFHAVLSTKQALCAPPDHATTYACLCPCGAISIRCRTKPLALARPLRPRGRGHAPGNAPSCRPCGLTPTRNAAHCQISSGPSGPYDGRVHHQARCPVSLHIPRHARRT
ncbi:hypothetical protein C2E23DRAFT_456808 [Lenzites betulinus]|nr:hypothetical protein C2E23DRAFT_456808 [Lenzites betulinus]